VGAGSVSELLAANATPRCRRADDWAPHGAVRDPAADSALRWPVARGRGGSTNRSVSRSCSQPSRVVPRPPRRWRA